MVGYEGVLVVLVCCCGDRGGKFNHERPELGRNPPYTASTDATSRFRVEMWSRLLVLDQMILRYNQLIAEVFRRVVFRRVYS